MNRGIEKEMFLLQHEAQIHAYGVAYQHAKEYAKACWQAFEKHGFAAEFFAERNKILADYRWKYSTGGKKK